MQGQAPALYYVVPTGLASCKAFTGHKYLNYSIGDMLLSV